MFTNEAKGNIASFVAKKSTTYTGLTHLAGSVQYHFFPNKAGSRLKRVIQQQKSTLN